jgi:hypothetical protein
MFLLSHVIFEKRVQYKELRGREWAAASDQGSRRLEGESLSVDSLRDDGEFQIMMVVKVE